MKYQDTLPKRAKHVITRHQRYRNTDIIKGLGVSKASFYNWTNPKHRDYKKEFDESIKQSKEDLAIDIENAILKEACGYHYKEKTEYFDNNGKVRRTVIKRKYKHPSIKALIFMICNLKPERYCNCQCVKN
ncbi:MAG: hypothetical protein ACRCTJ_06195 [Brevinema sp.]